MAVNSPARPRLRASGVVLAGLALAACGGAPDDGREAAGAAAVEAPAHSARAPGSERGELLSLACRACHTLGRGEPHLVGPNLFGMFGRRAGSLEDFDYSDALAGSDFVWTAERLDTWLAKPDEFLPGTTMAFTGYESAADRRALIAYLRDATAPPGAD